MSNYNTNDPEAVAIRKKIEKLQSMGREAELYDVISLEDVELFEFVYEVKLPEDYVWFITNVENGGIWEGEWPIYLIRCRKKNDCYVLIMRSSDLSYQLNTHKALTDAGAFSCPHGGCETAWHESVCAMPKKQPQYSCLQFCNHLSQDGKKCYDIFKRGEHPRKEHELSIQEE